MRLLFGLYCFGLLLCAEEKVVLQLKWLHQFQFAGYYAALEQGFYRDEGLEVEIRERDLSKDNIAQVIEGEAHYGIADSVLLLYSAKNEPVSIVAPIFQHAGNILITLKNSGLDSPYKLDGKQITFYKKDADGFGILALFKSLGLKPEYQRIKDRTNHTHLIEGKSDAYVGYLSNEPYYFQAAGIDINILYPAHYGFDLYGDMLFTHRDEATHHPERVERFKRASLRGWVYALQHKEEVAQLIQQKYRPDKTLEHLLYEADAIEQLSAHKSIPLGTIDRGRIRYTLDLYHKYGLLDNPVALGDYIFEPITSKNAPTDFLTPQERDYLKSKGTLKLCIDPDWMPFERSKDCVHEGLSAEYFKRLSEAIETPITPVCTQSWGESLALGRARGCDLFSLVMPTKERRSFLNFTSTYLRASVAIATRLDKIYIDNIDRIADQTLGIVEGYAFAEILRERYPSLKLVTVSHLEEGLEQVVKGKLYGMIDTLPTLAYTIQHDYLGQLTVAGKFDETWNFSIGTRNDEPLLRSIFDKALKSIPEATQQEIQARWFNTAFERRDNYERIILLGTAAVGALALILGFVLWINRRLKVEIMQRKKAERILEELSLTDALTGLYNRRHLSEHFPRMLGSAARERQTLCFALMDIDRFKQYNDTYGHASGDDAIRRVAQVLQSAMQRGDDYCYRMGGEEFALLFKGASKKEASAQIEQIRTLIEALRIEHKSSDVAACLSASFGLVVRSAREIESMEQIYKEADSLLYQAKAQGRNRIAVNGD
ncbi:MAG: diguanylate cyclase [Campylobacterales bacterium]|nr:diguanylate cyclase [Campylobacterales bacterium]